MKKLILTLTLLGLAPCAQANSTLKTAAGYAGQFALAFGVHYAGQSISDYLKRKHSVKFFEWKECPPAAAVCSLGLSGIAHDLYNKITKQNSRTANPYIHLAAWSWATLLPKYWTLQEKKRREVMYNSPHVSGDTQNPKNIDDLRLGLHNCIDDIVILAKKDKEKNTSIKAQWSKDELARLENIKKNNDLNDNKNKDRFQNILQDLHSGNFTDKIA